MHKFYTSKYEVNKIILKRTEQLKINGMTIEKIAEYTNLSIERIESLLDE